MSEDRIFYVRKQVVFFLCPKTGFNVVRHVLMSEDRFLCPVFFFMSEDRFSSVADLMPLPHKKRLTISGSYICVVRHLFKSSTSGLVTSSGGGLNLNKAVNEIIT